MLNQWRQNIIQLNNNLPKYSSTLKTCYTVVSTSKAVPIAMTFLIRYQYQ